VEYDEDLNDMNKGLDTNHGATAWARNTVVGSKSRNVVRASGASTKRIFSKWTLFFDLHKVCKKL
jgi:hypothetical protein